MEALPLGEFLSLCWSFRLVTGGGSVGCERLGGGVKRLVDGRVCCRPLSLASRGVRSDETDEAIRRLRGSSEYGDDDRELSESVGDPLSEALWESILRVGDNRSRRRLASELGGAELLGDGTNWEWGGVVDEASDSSRTSASTSKNSPFQPSIPTVGPGSADSSSMSESLSSSDG